MIRKIFKFFFFFDDDITALTRYRTRTVKMYTSVNIIINEKNLKLFAQTRLSQF